MSHRLLAIDYRRSGEGLPVDFGARVEFHSGETPHGGYDGLRASGAFARQLTETLRGEVSAGSYSLENLAFTKKLSEPVYGAQLGWDPRWDTHFRAQFGQDLVYADWMQAGAVTETLSAMTGVLAAETRPVPRVRALAQATRAMLGDGNAQHTGDVSLLYGVSADASWVWLGFGAWMTAFSEPASSYWSPEYYFNYGPRIEVLFPLLRNLTWSAGGQFQRGRERYHDFAYGYYGNARVQYAISRGARVEFAYTRFASLPPAGWTPWSRDDLMLSFSAQL